MKQKLIISMTVIASVVVTASALGVPVASLVGATGSGELVGFETTAIESTDSPPGSDVEQLQTGTNQTKIRITQTVSGTAPGEMSAELRQLDDGDYVLEITSAEDSGNQSVRSQYHATVVLPEESTDAYTLRVTHDGTSLLRLNNTGASKAILATNATAGR